MKKLVKEFCIIAIILAIGFSLTVCDTQDTGNSGKNNDTPSPTVTEVIVSPSPAAVVKGEDIAFNAVVTGTNNPSQGVTWSIDPSTPAKNSGTNISAAGVLTVAAEETLPSLTVRATSYEDTLKSGTSTVTIHSDSQTVPTVSTVTVSPSTAIVEKGGKQTFTATVTGTNNPAGTVTWSITQTGKNEGTVISSGGELTVAAGETLATLTVRATSTVNTGKYGEAAVTVKEPSTPTGFNMTAAELVAGMRLGWNLGNTLDAHGGGTVTQMETAWGNPVTTQANIDTLKNRGFNIIRIPVSWSRAVDANYNIRTDFMARVKEIVDYAVNNDMYILLNTHHDEDIFKFTPSEKTASIAAFNKIWTQIADAFKNYGEKLIFEGLNEPRTIGSSAEWNGGTAEERAILNEHYVNFVNVVRASGGNNNKRFLLINTYGGSGTAAAINGLVLPADTAQNKIIVSFHNYAPYDFALNTNTDPSEGSVAVSTWNKNNSSDTSPISTPINNAYNKFAANGIPVIIGEFGAMNRNNESVRAQWAEYYVGYAAEKGMPCVWWDNGVTSGNGELFGLLNRNNNTWSYPLLVEALVTAAGSSGSGENVEEPAPPTVTGNMGSYVFGTQDGSEEPNYRLAIWELSSENVAIAKTAGAKVVLQLTSAPSAGMQFVWQGPATNSWWNSQDILGDNGSPLNSSVTWNTSAKTLTINLNANTVANYSAGDNPFTAQSQLRLLIQYFGGSGVNDLGITSANLQ